MDTAFRYSLSAANRQPCYRGGPCTLVCKAVMEETHDSKTLVFEDSQSRSFDFKPGQYVTFKFRIDGELCPRAYSICSTPTRPHNIQITVKRVPGGLVSNWLNDNLHPGMEVEIADIGGHFNYLDIPSAKPLFLSGGSGVTPVMSMLQYITDVVDRTDVVFVYFARSPKDIIFREQLEFIAKRFRNVKVHLVVGDDSEQKDFGGTTGQIGAELMRTLVPDLAEREIFMCGPEGFMKAARAMAEEVSVAALHEESFGEKIVVEDTDGLGGEVYFSLSGKQGACAPGETLLEAALNVGIWIDSSCQQGVCGSCKVKMTQGHVDMDDLGGLSDDEKAEGYVLACCSRPRGAISLEA
ncbi:hybrid-cluster NAD(P)-dependent oxidoreductase [Mesorhizobium sp. INR15]|uniref:hybrid-cluster NAD(P)-dependent oxidoreductase n=1 Tax=Mesorhizobium sp. INR15 TaxID=2654248 RepID=UPI0021566ABD|nr:hybrid-cluster NAD(P)-dependent oxidoreductase [Mesorhizobium sp. INR15]